MSDTDRRLAALLRIDAEAYMDVSRRLRKIGMVQGDHGSREFAEVACDLYERANRLDPLPAGRIRGLPEVPPAA